MDRHWLLTSTFYGNWLPGDPRGFVSRVRDDRPDDPPAIARQEHDHPGTPYDADAPGLRRSATELLKGEPIRLTQEQAVLLADQFERTATYRGWVLLAAAVMDNHVHWVVGVWGDPTPEKLLQDLKGYGSRALNERYGKPVAGTWWTSSGSKRKLPDEIAVRNAVRYLLDQERPLVTRVHPDYAGERGT